MILDHWENSARYVGLHRGFAEAFAFLHQPQLAQLPVGRHEIAGDQILLPHATALQLPTVLR